jgi:hypothetical protein
MPRRTLCILVTLVSLIALLLLAIVRTSAPEPATVRATPRPVRTTTRCVVSSRGTDGLGHQLESRYSCMTVALELGFEYRHSAFEGPAAPFESFFRLGELAPPVGNLTQLPREPLPHVGRCHRAGWLALAAVGKQPPCEADAVYVADNCFDRLWCQTLRTTRGRALWFDRVLPQLRSRLPAALLHAPNSVHTVVVHIRRGDAGARILADAVFLGAMRLVRARLGTNSTMRFLVHTNDPRPLSRALLDAPGIELYQSPMRHTEESVGRENETLRLIEHFLTADVLILSRSSLSYSLAMLANTTTFFPACENDRPLWLLGWTPFPCST